MSRAWVVAAAVVALASAAGCASSSEPRQKEDISTDDSELRLSQSRYLGPITSGETKTTSYWDPPVHRAYGFHAQGGDEITVEVSSPDGDAMAWITTASYDVLASNDDANSSTLDAQVVYRVPASAASRSYRLVFREYGGFDATFTVKLTVKPAATCVYEGSTHAEGESFPASDGCNTCSCGAGGNVVCTKKACATCNPENEPWRNYIGNPTTCPTIRYVCAPNQRSFQNDCGCGCELLSH